MKTYKLNTLADDWRNSIVTLKARNDEAAAQSGIDYLKANNHEVGILLDGDFYQIARIGADGTIKSPL